MKQVICQTAKGISNRKEGRDVENKNDLGNMTLGGEDDSGNRVHIGIRRF